MSLWGLVAHFALPPPLILTALLVLPVPRVVRRGLLSFTRSILFAHVVGSHLRLVHFMLIVTGAMFSVTAVHTARVRSPAIDDTPQQRMSMLGYKWRQERNFWISCFTFVLWGLLYRLMYLMLHHEAVKARVVALELQLGLAPTQESLSLGASKGASSAAPSVDKTATAPPLVVKKKA